ncbi:MAG: cobalamin biosynthesis protein CbiM [Candidatus Dadabacteria bacterium]|nr:MAG: cobalamin biosynthesis protein CbiM [Candidatus Dadabacteria bacterium]
MHIPDGFIAPQVYLPAYGVAGVAWSWALRRVRSLLREETIPRLAVLTALSFVLMSVMIPLPGGTSAHATGVALLALAFGVQTAFLAVSLVLLVQALVLGAGGVTALPLNALAIGLAGGLAARASYRILRPAGEAVALIAAGWVSINLAALILAVVLGIQPLVAHDPSGRPLFFPFGLAVTIPAMAGIHAVVGIGEGLLTLLVWRAGKRRGWFGP